MAKIGDKITIGGTGYKVVEAHDGCKGCGFYARGEIRCGGIIRRCKWFTRPDRKSIIYKRYDDRAKNGR